MECLIQAGVNNGFSKEFSSNLVKNTARGAIKLCEKEKDLNLLINKVASPGGTTEAALEVLDIAQVKIIDN